jgi:hypothetical protein
VAKDQESFFQSLRKNHHYNGSLSFATRIELYDALDKYITERLPHNLTCVSLFAINGYNKASEDPNDAFSEYTKRYYMDKCMTIDHTRREDIYEKMTQINTSYKMRLLCMKITDYVYFDQIDVDFQNNERIGKLTFQLLQITNELAYGERFYQFWRKYPKQSKTNIMKNVIKKHCFEPTLGLNDEEK